jgi:hypothetical protein
MTEGRIVIIPFLHGKPTVHGTVIEADIDAILEKWLERPPSSEAGTSMSSGAR